MSALEHTIPMRKSLSETDLFNIRSYTKSLPTHQEYETADETIGEFLRPMSQDDFMRDIETAEQQILDGKYHNAEEVFHEWKCRYKL